MKRNFLLNSGICILVTMGVMTPFSSVAYEQGKMDSARITHLISEIPTAYGNPGEDFAKTERGAMGPKGSSRMEGSVGESHLYSEKPTEYGK